MLSSMLFFSNLVNKGEGVFNKQLTSIVGGCQTFLINYSPYS